MSSHNPTSGFWQSGVAGAGLAVLFGLFFPAAKPLTELSYDLPYLFRPESRIEQAVIVYMDDASHTTLSQTSQAAWDRKVHAQLVRRLTECRARAVVFDIHFEGTNTHDPLLFEAIRVATNAGTQVVVAGKVEPVKLMAGNPGTKTVPPFNEDLQALLPWGLAEVGAPDTTLRWHFNGIDPDFSLAWRVAQLRLTNALPSPTSVRWFNYYGPPGTIPSHSYHRVIETNAALAVPASEFSNRVVFVGANAGVGFTGGTGTDHFRTPYSHWDDDKYPGTEVNATAYLNLANNDWLRRFPRHTERLCIVLLGGLFGFGLTRCRPLLATSLAGLGAAALTAVACLLVWHLHVWFAWLIVVAIQIPVALGWSLVARTHRLQRDKARLEAQLATIQPGETATDRVEPALSQRPTPPPMPAPPVVEPAGPLVPDHTLVHCVGRGAYGEVWLARNLVGTCHAVKIVYRNRFESAAPFDREFNGIQKFMPISRLHPGLVQILHVGRNEPAGYIYCIMEPADDEVTGAQIAPNRYVPKSLAGEIRRRGHLAAAECVSLALDLTAALEFLHQQHLIHRDIKPSNIIFVRGAPKFADIGLVTEFATPGHDVSGLGTEGYIAPEGPGQPAADVYSLGMVLYDASMGLGWKQFPQLPTTLLQRADKEPLLQLNEIILKACAPDPGNRYQSAAEMHADLARLNRHLLDPRQAE